MSGSSGPCQGLPLRGVIPACGVVVGGGVPYCLPPGAGVGEVVVLVQDRLDARVALAGLGIVRSCGGVLRSVVADLSGQFVLAELGRADPDARVPAAEYLLPATWTGPAC